MSHIAMFNTPELFVWNEDLEEALIIQFDDNILSYVSLEYVTPDEMGIYAYGVNENDIIQLRDHLIKIGRFLPTQLYLSTIKNYARIAELKELRVK